MYVLKVEIIENLEKQLARVKISKNTEHHVLVTQSPIDNVLVHFAL